MAFTDPSRYVPTALDDEPTLELMWAANEGNLANLRAALEAGADVNVKLIPHEFPADGESHRLHGQWPYSTLGEHCAGDTPLHIAARLGLESLVQELLRWKASAHIANEIGETPLETASTRGCKAAILESQPTSSAGRSFAASSPSPWDDSPAAPLIGLPGDVSAQTMAACLSRHEGIRVSREELDPATNPFAALLMPRAASSAETGSSEEEPSATVAFFWAVWEGDLERLEALLESGANLAAGLVPHEFPAAGRLHEEHNGWPYSDLDGAEFGDTALHLAARKGHRAIVTVLLAAGAEAAAVNDAKQTAHQVARGDAAALLPG